MTERKVIQINHALSGVYGKQLKQAAQKISDSRKQILRRLQRKKKLASVIQDQLYWFLERFPQQKEGLHKQSMKKKKTKINIDQQQSIKSQHLCPSIQTVTRQSLLQQQDKSSNIQQKFNKWFQFSMKIQEQPTN